MPSTIDTYHTKISAKIDTLTNINQQLNLLIPKLSSITQSHIQNICLRFNSVEKNYITNTTPLLLEYYDESQSNRSEIAVSEEYYQTIISDNIVCQLDNIIKEIKILIGYELTYTYDIDDMLQNDQNILQGDDVLISFVKTYKKNINISDIKITKNNFEMCECGNKFDIHADTSELRCRKCGIVKTLYGTIFEDTQFYNQDGGSRSKNGGYSPSRHCQLWIQRIQANDTIEIPEEIIKLLWESVYRDNIKPIQLKFKLTCELIRIYLRNITITETLSNGNIKTKSGSEYNDHTPLIRKQMTGETPYQMIHIEKLKLSVCFDTAIKIFEIIKPSKRSNNLFYPYVLYKCIEMIFKLLAKKSLLNCIHLQSQDTLTKNDIIWEQICIYQNDHRTPNDIEFIYTPTDHPAEI